MDAPDAAAVPLAERIDALVAGLGHAAFAERAKSSKALTQLLVEEGKPAFDLLNADTYRRHDDPEVAYRVREVLAAAEPRVVTTWTLDKIETLVARGLNPDVLGQLNAGGQPVARLMLRAHLQGTLGVDVLYSLAPGNVLPDACRLLAMQEEEYYQTLLARVVAGVLARAIRPVDASQPMDLGGIEWLGENQDAARAMAALTASPCDELRLTALRACAYALVPLPEGGLERLLADGNRDIASEAARIRCVFERDANERQPDATCAGWIAGCVRALSQDDDRLAQLGAYNALTCLVDHRVGELYAAWLAADGRAGDALGHVLSSSLIGRLLMVRDGKREAVWFKPSVSLGRIMALWEYDVTLRGLEHLVETDPEAVAPLLRRNLFVLGRSRGTWFDRVTWSQEAWTAAVRLGMRDLAPVLVQQIGQHRDGEQFAPLLKALSETSGERSPTRPASDWYALCARHLDAGLLDIRTGAVRAILASGRAGAQALLARQRAGDWKDPDFGPYLRSLVMFHPYSPFLVDDTEAGRLLATDLANSTLQPDGPWQPGKDGRRAYDGGLLRVPVALWGYAHNNDCVFMNPFGNYLAKELKPVHAPLVLSWLDHSSRMSIFLIEVDARDAREAVLRRVRQRRTDWGHCYDHDLFNYVVVYELLEALPFLEHYTKTNTNWPYKGIRTMAGIEKDRYCWTPPVRSGRINPLVLPSCRELLKHCGGNGSVAKHASEILAEFPLKE